MHFAKSKILNVSAFKARVQNSLQANGIPTIEPFKSALKAALGQLQLHQNQGISAAELINKFTWAVDRLVIESWKTHTKAFDCADALELLAVGGYGRGELHPYSDVDLLLLRDEKTDENVDQCIEHFLRFLWDIGMDVGHSVRTIKDCSKEARADVTVMTNLLEARSLFGGDQRFKLVDEQIRKGRIWPSDKFFNAKVEEQEGRHTQHQGSAYSLEPNIKDSPGGLRDLQTILWIYNRQYGVRSFKDMKEQGHINDDEYRLLIRARNIMWKLRTGLHLLSGRHEDRLMFDAQRSLAQEFGYIDDAKALAVEQLMKRYYRTAKQIAYLNEVLLSAYKVSNSSWSILSRQKKIDEDFVLIDKSISQKDPELFEKKPVAMLKMFALMQEQKINAIHPDTIRSIRANLDKVDNQFRNNEEAKAIFINMFRHKGIGLTNALARMNAYDLLGAYLPPFGAIVGQMQHDLFHVYTVDGHTLMVMSNLTRLRKYPDEFPVASELLNKLYKPERLLIGALFHDIAKGRGGDHSVLGESDAVEFCLAHGLSEYDAKFVGWLVLQHLMMSHFSQRRDISDPEVIKEFAAIVGDLEHLEALYLLTLADIRGTSPKVWNAWKGQLLLDLYNATRNELRAGVEMPADEQEHVDDRKNTAMQKIIAQLGDNEQVRQDTESFWSTLHNDYFLRTEPFYLAWHVVSLSSCSSLNLPLVSIRYSERMEANMFFVVAPASQNLLTRVTHAFDDTELNIIDARLQLTRHGLALYTLTAHMREDKDARDRDYLAALEREMRTIILNTEKSKLISRRKASRALKHFPIKPYIEFSYDHPKFTTLEVEAQDQPGLLHNVALILQEHQIELVNARITTFGERAEDVFFIRRINRKPIKGDSALLDSLQTQIAEALTT